VNYFGVYVLENLLQNKSWMVLQKWSFW